MILQFTLHPNSSYDNQKLEIYPSKHDAFIIPIHMVGFWT